GPIFAKATILCHVSRYSSRNLNVVRSMLLKLPGQKLGRLAPRDGGIYDRPKSIQAVHHREILLDVPPSISTQLRRELRRPDDISHVLRHPEHVSLGNEKTCLAFKYRIWNSAVSS